MNNTFTDDQILVLNENDFNRNQINRLEELALDFNLDLDDVYNDISQIINGYHPQEPDFDVRISNEILISLLENGYSLEDIQSLLEYELIDEDFEWLLDNPHASYEDVYHLLGAQWSFDEIKEYYDNGSDNDESDDDESDDDESDDDESDDDESDNDESDDDDLDMGGKRSKTKRRQRKTKRRQRKTKRRKQSKTRRRKSKTRRRKSKGKKIRKTKRKI